MRKRNLAAERIALREASIVICNSRRTRDDVVERVGIEAHRAHVVYYGADPVKFSVVSPSGRADAKRELRLDPSRPLVGFVGALGDRRKGFDTLFEAWTALCRLPNWDANLMVVGAGAEIPQWKRRAREAGLADRMTFAGYRFDMPAVFAALDVLVHPARYEAYGLSVHEALCRGVPAFVSAFVWRRGTLSDQSVRVAHFQSRRTRRNCRSAHQVACGLRTSRMPNRSTLSTAARPLVG